MGLHLPLSVKNSASLSSTSASTISPPIGSAYSGKSSSPIRMPKLFTALSFGLPTGRARFSGIQLHIRYWLYAQGKADDSGGGILGGDLGWLTTSLGSPIGLLSTLTLIGEE